MKLDILKNQWLDIVFEGRNKTYGAYELRKSNRKTTISAYSRSDIFIALAAPLIIDLLPKGAEEDMDRDIKSRPLNLQEKEEPKCSTTTHTKVDQVKFVSQWLLRQKK
jgi:protein TonB